MASVSNMENIYCLTMKPPGHWMQAMRLWSKFHEPRQWPRPNRKMHVRLLIGDSTQVNWNIKAWQSSGFAEYLTIRRFWVGESS